MFEFDFYVHEFLIKKAANNLQLFLRDLNFYPNRAEATPATAITIPPHLITG